MKRSAATNKNSLYDSYFRAFRWATNRVGDHGVVAFVSNGGWIDSKTATGVRLSFADEFSRLYVYNLRGNQTGDWKREGGKVFGEGSQTTIAILIGIKAPEHTGPCEVFYRDIGDYLSREDKLAAISPGTVDSIEWRTIYPDVHGDWINQRGRDFPTWPPLGNKKGGLRIFKTHAYPLLTARDAWVYNFSLGTLKERVPATIQFYNTQATIAVAAKTSDNNPADAISYDTKRISWSSSLIAKAEAGAELQYRPDEFVEAEYRPFLTQHLYFDRDLNHRVGLLPRMFPSPAHGNIGFCVVGTGSEKPFSVLMVSRLPDLSFWGSGSSQYFPRWTYEKAGTDDGTLALEAQDASEIDEYGYRRVDNITDEILKLYQEVIGDEVTKDGIFFYVYGLLHDPAYRETYAADLKKLLPHIPTPQTRARFEQLAAAGRALSDLHIGYENVKPHPVDVELKPGADPVDRETWRVTKLKWAKRKDPGTGKSVNDVTKLIYNPKVTITRIPEEAERYTLGSRSALAWIIDRYRVKTDKASGIVNDPNDWCDEHDDPRYIVDLIAKVTTVAVETMKIVDRLAE